MQNTPKDRSPNGRSFALETSIFAGGVTARKKSKVPPACEDRLQPVCGRFAPSPSGRMHVGNVFSCLMAWLAARSAGGEMVLRIEDLDPRSHHPELARQLMDDLLWLGLPWDRGPIYQHDRKQAYAQAVEELAARGLVYPCFCTRRELHAASAPHTSDGTYVYPGTCRTLSPKEVAERSRTRAPGWRLFVDGAAPVAFEDEVYGHFCEDVAQSSGDILIQRSDGVYAYQLAVVVDDANEAVNLVVRGRDLLGSTARQIYLQECLGLPRPRYMHVPLLVAPDGRRLSKRDHDLDLGLLRKRYGSPEPLLGALGAAVGFCKPGAELRSEELIPLFSLAQLRAHRKNIVVDDGFLP